MNDIIIDFEFTGLPTKLHKPEICQMLIKNMTNGKSCIKNFRTNVPMTASAIVCCGGDPTKDADVMFSFEEFNKVLSDMGASLADDFHGFSIKTDSLLLKKYGINLPHYYDIQEQLQLSTLEYDIAIGGRSLEACYYLVTKQILNTTHGTTAELEAIEVLYNWIANYLNDNKLRQHLTYMPWGDYAGVPISEYVEEERRRADGYRFNNSDLLAVSMDYWIEYNEFEDYFFSDLDENEEEEDINNMEDNPESQPARRPRKSQIKNNK